MILNADHDRSHVLVLASRLQDPFIIIEDICRERRYQHRREADFHDLSETTTSRCSTVQLRTNSCTSFDLHMAVMTPKGEHYGHILFGIKRYY